MTTLLNNQVDDRRLRRFDKFLRHVAVKYLPPANEYRREANALVKAVFEKLVKYSHYKVHQYRVGGSFGKRTDVMQPDLDLVVILNKLGEPPFFDALQNFEKILLKYQKELRIQAGTIERKSRFSLEFKFQNGIDVDLLPAVNKSPDEIYALLLKNPDNHRGYSSSLIDRQLGFINYHADTFLRNVIRIVKFWFKTLFFGNVYVVAGSTMMELLTITAVANEKKSKGKGLSILRTFTKVLDMLIDIDNLKLAFTEKEDDATKVKHWVPVPPEMLTPQNAKFLVPKVIGVKDILRQRCFMMDPSNPYNDILAGFQNRRGIKKLQGFATVTKQRVEHLLSNEEVEEVEELDEDETVAVADRKLHRVRLEIEQDKIMQIFQPQPLCLLHPKFATVTPYAFLVDYNIPQVLFCSEMEVRRDGLLERKEIRSILYKLKWNLTSAVNSALRIYRYQEDNFDKVKEVTRFLVESSLNVKLAEHNDDRKDETEKHEFKDVTLTIPYVVDDRTDHTGYVLKLSMDWKEISNEASSSSSSRNFKRK